MTERELLFEGIAMTAVTDTCAALLTYPFGFHGDTGMREYLYARLQHHDGEHLVVDDPRPGFSTLQPLGNLPVACHGPAGSLIPRQDHAVRHAADVDCARRGLGDRRRY